uniref:ATP-dependent Clp protease proteolytic subunit n=1 Tax=Klebsiella pneumoniae TaxID=573 RepID=UPI00190F8217
MKCWYTIKAASDATSANISIYEEIGGWGITAQQFSEDLEALGDISHISLHVHSPGGDVFDGIAIYNLLNKH